MIAAHSDDTASLFDKPLVPYPSSMGSAFHVARKPWEQQYIVSSACFIPTTKLAATSHFTGRLRLWMVEGYPSKIAGVLFDGDEPAWLDWQGAPIADPAAWWLAQTG
ncbi:MAG: hypothetical protein WKG01_02445 [Kofleriaceae bacterium]